MSDVSFRIYTLSNGFFRSIKRVYYRSVENIIETPSGSHPNTSADAMDGVNNIDGSNDGYPTSATLDSS